VLRSVIVDDEAAARARLARMLAEHPDVELLGEAGDGLQAVERIESLKPDLLFLDIEMPGLTGFEVLRSIQDRVPPPLVIFVTGYDEHALAAFEASALAYLLKPVAPDRLALAVERARKLCGFPQEAAGERQRALQAGRALPRPLRYVVCRRRDQAILLRPAEVFWFAVESGIVRARTATESFWVNYQLAELQARLPEELFFRARRETLLNVTKIRTITPSAKSGFRLVMADAAATEIVVSERRAAPLRQRLPGL
jgi:DNA-binding LytR/AlgR family response regulator